MNNSNRALAGIVSPLAQGISRKASVFGYLCLFLRHEFGNQFHISSIFELAATEMTLQELADKEDALYRKVVDLNQQPESDQTDKTLQDIFFEYKKIHQIYAELSFTHNEALKRGLFIQWYALAEPNYLSGIADLNENAENKIIQALNDRVEAGNADKELTWMFNYYANWGWIFERLTSFKGFNSTIVNEQNKHLPGKIDRVGMAQRGQMGKYWNSLTKNSVRFEQTGL